MAAIMLRRAFYGFVMGDAFGVPYEFKTRGTYEVQSEMVGYQTHFKPAGTWSDDTSLTLATINALFEPYELANVMDNFVSYLDDAAFTPYQDVFDVGIGTREAILTYKVTHEVVPFKADDEMNNGNGALMRIWPVAFFDFTADLTLEDVIDQLTGLTHGHRRARLASRFFVYLLRMMPRVKNIERALEMAIRRSNRTAMETATLETEDLGWLAVTDSQSVQDAIATIKRWSRTEVPSTGYVVDTLKAVLWTLLHTTSYQEAVMMAAGLGDDTDTIAALVGVIASFAYDEFPEAWFDALGAKDKIERELILADESGKFA
ncbi:ADP-ribosylglycohydrolase family protein [Weissella cibaria]|uniref:ADP-ribosylglycohydrolase family protein n=1 Tax=Weissella cibaria TaxID=137591 RepID=UPI00106EFC7F|nr:ADP-ribosylglycohydrolase family protein [Weissella cibaria]